MTKPEWGTVEYWEERNRLDELRFQQSVGWLPKPAYVMGVACEIVQIDPDKETERNKQRAYW